MALVQIDITRLAALGTALGADKAALKAKGVDVPEGTKHDDIAGLIESIPSEQAGGNSATEPYVEETFNGNNIVSAKLHGFTVIRNHMFYNSSGLTSLQLPDSIKAINTSAFRQNPNLELSTLPQNVTDIGTYAFDGDSSITITDIPKSTRVIGTNAFRNCTGLTEITFHSKPVIMQAGIFTGCTNLTTIRVPWAESEVANAPWGATNAQIQYNYVEGE